MGGNPVRIIAIVFVVWAFALGCGAAAVPKEAMPKRTCQPQRARASDLWSDEVRIELALAVRVFEGKIEPADAERITRSFTELSEHWQEAATRACQGYLDDPRQGSEQHAASVECLEKVAQDGQALIVAIGEGNIDRMGEVEQLDSRIDTCVD